MEYERNVAREALNRFKGISLRIEIEEVITSGVEGYTHTLTPTFYKDNHKNSFYSMDPDIITNEDDKPLAQKSLQIVVNHLLDKNDEFQKVLQTNAMKVIGPTNPRKGNSSVTITRKL